MKKKISIVGGGTAGLFLAAFLNTDLYDITIFEKKTSLGRKFLVAGDGGFNLTHAEDLPNFKLRYTPTSFLDNALNHFSNTDFRAWLLSIGIPTFVGSSGRVFPEQGMKPIEVLKSTEAFLLEKNVKFIFNKTFTGWGEDDALEFNSTESVKSDYVFFALGGSSWKVTGSDGLWLNIFALKGISAVPFIPSNCAYQIQWEESFIQKQEGRPLKNISLSLANQIQKGEAVITRFGLEGNAIYGLSPSIQATLALHNEVVVYADFKPTISIETLIEKLINSKSNITVTLKEAVNLSSTVVDLIKCTLTKDEFLDIETLAHFIKKFPLTIIGSAPIDEAISTSGGIMLKEVDSNFELKKIKNQFCIGEMLDWDAPTGGYLIQACASMGAYVADQFNNK